MTENWTLSAGEYAFHNGGAWLGDVPAPRLFEIAYFLLHRDLVLRINTEEFTTAQAKADRRLTELLREMDDDDTGLPAGLAAFGIAPADAGKAPSPFN